MSANFLLTNWKKFFFFLNEYIKYITSLEKTQRCDIKYGIKQRAFFQISIITTVYLIIWIWFIITHVQVWNTQNRAQILSHYAVIY